ETDRENCNGVAADSLSIPFVPHARCDAISGDSAFTTGRGSTISTTLLFAARFWSREAISIRTTRASSRGTAKARRNSEQNQPRGRIRRRIADQTQPRLACSRFRNRQPSTGGRRARGLRPESNQAGLVDPTAVLPVLKDDQEHDCFKHPDLIGIAEMLFGWMA